MLIHTAVAPVSSVTPQQKPQEPVDRNSTALSQEKSRFSQQKLEAIWRAAGASDSDAAEPGGKRRRGSLLGPQPFINGHGHTPLAAVANGVMQNGRLHLPGSAPLVRPENGLQGGSGRSVSFHAWLNDGEFFVVQGQRNQHDCECAARFLLGAHH